MTAPSRSRDARTVNIRKQRLGGGWAWVGTQVMVWHELPMAAVPNYEYLGSLTTQSHYYTVSQGQKSMGPLGLPRGMSRGPSWDSFGMFMMAQPRSHFRAGMNHEAECTAPQSNSQWVVLCHTRREVKVSGSLHTISLRDAFWELVFPAPHNSGIRRFRSLDSQSQRPKVTSLERASNRWTA